MKKKTAKPKVARKDSLIVSVFAPHAQWTALRAVVQNHSGKIVKTIQQDSLEEEVFNGEHVAKFLERVARTIRDEDLL